MRTQILSFAFAFASGRFGSPVLVGRNRHGRTYPALIRSLRAPVFDPFREVGGTANVLLARLLLNQFLAFCIKNNNQPNHQNIASNLPRHNIKHREKVKDQKNRLAYNQQAHNPKKDFHRRCILPVSFTRKHTWLRVSFRAPPIRRAMV